MERRRSLSASPPSEDQPGAEVAQEEQEHMDFVKAAKDRRVSATNGNMPRLRRPNRQGVYEGYAVTRAGQVVVDASQVFGDAEMLERALRVAKRAQEIGRRTSREG